MIYHDTTTSKGSEAPNLSAKIYIPMQSFGNIYHNMQTCPYVEWVTSQWRHDERHGVSNEQPHDCLLNRFFKAQINENIKAPPHWPLWGELIPRTKGQ